MSDKLSRENKIKEMLRGHIHEVSISFVVGEIEKMIDEKLFEVDGKVAYFIQWLDGKTWTDNFNHGENTIWQAEKVMEKQEKNYPKTMHRIIKRHTTDQIIEESHEKPA